MYRLFFLCLICLISCHENENKSSLDSLSIQKPVFILDNLNRSPVTVPRKDFIGLTARRNNIEMDKYCVDENPSITNNPVGKYRHNSGKGHKTLLTIKDDKTFESSSNHCKGTTKSEGKWVQSGNKITLKSFPQYKRTYDNPNSLSAEDLFMESMKKNYFDNWTLKVGEDFLSSKGFRSDTYNIIYEKSK